MTALASKYSDRVAGLVYLDAAADHSTMRTMETKQQQEILAATGMRENVWREIAASMSKPDYSKISVPPLAFFAVPRSASDMLKSSIELLSRHPELGGVPQSMREALDSYNRNDVLTRAAIDKAFIDTRRMAEEGIESFKVGLPHGRVVELLGGSHLVYLSNESEVLREIRAFLADLQ
jgi:pimeloyl-ACP methyl ester carboxylesterase